MINGEWSMIVYKVATDHSPWENNLTPKTPTLINTVAN